MKLDTARDTEKKHFIPVVNRHQFCPGMAQQRRNMRRGAPPTRPHDRTANFLLHAGLQIHQHGLRAKRIRWYSISFRKEAYRWWLIWKKLRAVFGEHPE